MDTFIRKRGRVMRTFSEVEFTEYDQYLFGQGTHYAVHRKLGAHPAEKGDSVFTPMSTSPRDS